MLVFNFVHARDDAIRVFDNVWYAESVLDDEANEMLVLFPSPERYSGVQRSQIVVYSFPSWLPIGPVWSRGGCPSITPLPW